MGSIYACKSGEAAIQNESSQADLGRIEVATQKDFEQALVDNLSPDTTMDLMSNVFLLLLVRYNASRMAE